MSQPPKSEVNMNHDNNQAITYYAGEDITRFEKDKRAELQEHQVPIDEMGRLHELRTVILDHDVMEIKMQALLPDVNRQFTFLTHDDAKMKLYKRQVMAKHFILNHLITAVNPNLRFGLNDYAATIEAKRMHSFEEAFSAFRDYFSRSTLSGPKIIPHLSRAINHPTNGRKRPNSGPVSGDFSRKSHRASLDWRHHARGRPRVDLPDRSDERAAR